MKGKCLGKVKTAERTGGQDEYITKTPKAIARICIDSCPYDEPICGASGCDFFKAEKAKLRAGKKKWKEERM